MRLELAFNKTEEARGRSESVTSAQFRLIEELNAKTAAAQSTPGSHPC